MIEIIIAMIIEEKAGSKERRAAWAPESIISLLIAFILWGLIKQLKIPYQILPEKSNALTESGSRLE